MHSEVKSYNVLQNGLRMNCDPESSGVAPKKHLVEQGGRTDRSVPDEEPFDESEASRSVRKRLLKHT